MRSTISMKKKSAALVTAGVITVAAAGGAYAYWTTSGNGSGSAATGTSSAFVVTTDAATGSPLTPGGPTQTVAFHVHNPGSGAQNLSAVAVTVANSDGTAWTSVPGCSAADYTVGTPTFSAGQIPAGLTVNGTVTVSMINRAQSQDGCKNAIVPLYVAAS